MTRLAADGISLTFNADLGILEGFAVTDEGREIVPMHRAPWVGTDEVMPDDAHPHLARLGGDFFCAPFAASDDGSPLHGWPPNSAWGVDEAGSVPGGAHLRARLHRQVRGAQLTKELSLRDGHPFVYQSHIFEGGEGQITASNHANVSVKSGAFIRTSEKRVWETPEGAPEPDPARGRSLLSYPARQPHPHAFPGTDGPVDLTSFPWGPAHEDVVLGLEMPGHVLGWTAVTRPEEGDLFLSLRNAAEIPITTLWHSNGGRDYPPWSGRHFGCLGVEEGAVGHLLSLSTMDDLSGPGALRLGSRTRARIRHVIGAITWPTGSPIAGIAVRGDRLCVTGEDGAVRIVDFDTKFLGLPDERAE